MKRFPFIFLLMANGANACAQERTDPIRIVDHCDFYHGGSPIHEVLESADFAASIELVEGQTLNRYDRATFDIVKRYFGTERQNIVLLAGQPSNEDQYRDEIAERITLQSDQAFLWSYIGNPSSAAYSGESPTSCNAVPVYLPEQRYLIALKDEQILAFEPIQDEGSTLEPWFQYYGAHIRPTEKE